jgi:hypothetical protein
MKRIWYIVIYCGISCLLLLTASLSFSQSLMGVFDPVTKKVISVQGTGDGTLYSTPRPALGTDVVSQIIFSASITNADSATTVAFSNGMAYAFKSLKVTTSGTGAKGWAIKFLGSFDGITYGPIMDRKPAGVSVTVDTLKYLMVGSASAGPHYMELSHGNGNPILFPYIQARIYNHSAGALTFTLEMAGRGGI